MSLKITYMVVLNKLIRGQLIHLEKSKSEVVRIRT